MNSGQNPNLLVADASTDIAPDTTKTSGIEIQSETICAGVAYSTSEVINRYGSANAEYLKGYSGVDNETEQKYAKSLADIAKYKISVDPDEGTRNIKQQAGFSAEIATTSRDNAEAIISRSRIRTSRSDDLQQFGRNHNVVDRVQIRDGQIIEGTQSQMKFVGNRDQLLDNIAREDGKFARYRGTKLELPSEQYAGAAQHCRDKSKQLLFNAGRAEQCGQRDVAAKLRREADNYAQLATEVMDSGMTTEQAIFYRSHPKTATAFDIARTSHRAGMEGAQYGAVIGGCISLLNNSFATALGEKEFDNAAKGVALDTAKAGTVGYGIAFAGSAVKGAMQQSSSGNIRALADTTAPVLVVNICISLGGSIKRYVIGEINESQLLLEVGEKSTGMLSSGMMAALGQIVIPVPLIGAAIGGMIGCTLSSFFFQTAVDAARRAEISFDVLERTRAIQIMAYERIAKEQAALEAFVGREIPQLQQDTQQFFVSLDSALSLSMDAQAAAINAYAHLLGKKLQHKSMVDFEDFMLSDRTFRF